MTIQSQTFSSVIVTFLLNVSAFDPRSIDITRLLERCHRIIKRSSDNLPRGLFMPKSPKRQSAGSSRPILPRSTLWREERRLCREQPGKRFRTISSPDDSRSELWFPRGWASCDCSKASFFLPPAPSIFSFPPSYPFFPPCRRPYRDGEKRVYSSKGDYPSFAGQRIFPPRAFLLAQSLRLYGMVRRNESS